MNERIIHCTKLNEDLPGMDKAPYPTPIGKRIFDEISKQAWQNWLAHQTMLINENRLNLTDPTARKFLTTEMEKYLFGDGSDLPAGYTEK